MGAQPAHMDKYIEPYRRLFPSSPILVLRSEPGDWLVPWKKPDMSPGADVVRSLFPEIAAGSQPNPSPSTPRCTKAKPPPRYTKARADQNSSSKCGQMGARPRSRDCANLSAPASFLPSH
ncbi:hypothetical protein CcaverHIS002_0510860 [Cutaneotrichosporon cavernicola]|nr:hypothetical protein CcaverHIS002_0510860 [Cutaneotrichosporon cavernicola]